MSDIAVQEDPQELEPVPSKTLRIPLVLTVAVPMAQMMVEDETICAGVLVQCFRDSLPQLVKNTQAALEASLMPVSIIIPGVVRESREV